MIKLFEKITYPLTEREKEILPGFIKALKVRVGKENAITNSQITAAYASKGYRMDGPRIRKLISVIRTENLIKGLMASSKGYYISKDVQELKDYCESLEGRISAISKIKENIESYINEQS